jgi:MraZ protein
VNKLVVFRGTYIHTIDAKGRIFVPSALREGLSDAFTMFKLEDKKCLCAMATQDYENFSSDISHDKELIKDNPELLDYVLYPETVDIELDSQKRVLIPADMREFAGLGKDVVIVGIRNRVEFWNLDAWNERRKMVAEKMKGVSVSNLLAAR